MASLSTVAATFFAKASLSTGEKAAPGLLAGAGKSWIRFDDLKWPLDGFSGQHDSLGIRVLLLENTCGRFCIVVVELTSLSNELAASMKTLISEKIHTSVENILVCASHTFSAPHVFTDEQIPPGTDKRQNQEILCRLKTSLLTALNQAKSRLQPARIGFGSGACQININRDQLTNKGWWLGKDSNGFADPFVGVVRIDNLKGQPIAIMFNYAVQSSVTEGFQQDSEGKKISSDLAGAAARYIEEYHHSDMVAFFLLGAAGDQSPIFQAMQPVVNDNGTVSLKSNKIEAYKLLNQLAIFLGQEVVRIMEIIATSPPLALRMIRNKVTVPALIFLPENAPKYPVTTFHYQRAGNVEVPVILMQLGNIIWIGLQPELSAITAAYIRKRSPFSHTFVSTMVDGSAKYMPDATSYDRFTYEARNSPFAPGAAELIAQTIIKHLEVLHADIYMKPGASVNCE